MYFYCAETLLVAINTWKWNTKQSIFLRCLQVSVAFLHVRLFLGYPWNYINTPCELDVVEHGNGRSRSVWVESSIRKCVSGGKGGEETLRRRSVRLLLSRRGGRQEFSRAFYDEIDGVEVVQGKLFHSLPPTFSKQTNSCCSLARVSLPFPLVWQPVEAGTAGERANSRVAVTWNMHVLSRRRSHRKSPSNSVCLKPGFKWIDQRLVVTWH